MKKKTFLNVLRTQRAELSLAQYQNIIGKYTFIWQIQMYYETFIAGSARFAHLARKTLNEKQIKTFTGV